MSNLNTPVQDCFVALELSRTKWLVGALLPGRTKVITTLVPGGNATKLDTSIYRLRGCGGGELGGCVAWNAASGSVFGVVGPQVCPSGQAGAVRSSQISRFML
jgi:hypothetical protein